jgi:drug/metabolite transporter (DMT)-like permease
MIFIAIFEYAILASTFTISKVAVGYADPLFLIAVRMLCASPLMLLIDRYQKGTTNFIEKNDIKKIFLIGIFHIAIPFIGEFWALQFVSSAKTAIIYALTPFFAAILSYVLLKQKLSMLQIIGLSIGLLGLLPIVISHDELLQSAGEILMISLPEAVLIIAVISASYAWFLVSDLMKKGYGISRINGSAMFIGGLISLILWFFLGESGQAIKGNPWSFIGWTFLLIVVANIISYNLYGWLLKHMSITLMSAIGFFTPVFASIYGYVLLNEELGLSHIFALIMIGTGIWLFYREELKKSRFSTLAARE